MAVLLFACGPSATSATTAMRITLYPALLLVLPACAWTCSESDTGAQCDAGEQCGRCLLLVNASVCSSMAYHGNTRCSLVKPGEMCEGDGECGSDDDANNCATQEGKEPLKDVYLRVPCRGEPAAPGGGEEPAQHLRSVSSLMVASVLCGWLLMRAWRQGHLRPSASLAAADGAGGVQLDALPQVPVGRAVLVPVAEGLAQDSLARSDETEDDNPCGEALVEVSPRTRRMRRIFQDEEDEEHADGEGQPVVGHVTQR